MIPPFEATGKLPPGIHQAEWKEFCQRFGSSRYRKNLLAGLLRAIDALKAAGCQTIYLDGSFVTAKKIPGDYDACYSVNGIDFSRLDPVFHDFTNGRAAQKSKYGGEFFPAELPESISGLTFLDFFQVDKETTKLKGIVSLDLKTIV